MARHFTAMLGKRGHHVDVASNGCEAVEAAQRQTYDVILMDVQMPEMGGDGKIIARAAHAFKSAAASISARQLAALLAELEAAGKAGDLSAAQALAGRLHTESDAVLHYLGSVLEGLPHG